MATLTSAQHVFMFLWIIGSVAAGALEAKPGEDVTLQCNSQTGAAVTKLVWKRSDLEKVNVFLFSDGSPSASNQDPRYRGRVELKDPAVKNGDFSVLLKNVTLKDTGTYQCWVTPPNMQKELLCSVHLIVSEGPTKEELKKELEEELKKQHRRKVGLGVGLGVGCLVGVVVGLALGRFVYLKRKSGPL